MKYRDFNGDPKWREFGRAYVKCGGVITEACRECGIKEGSVYALRHRNPLFGEWLSKFAEKQMESTVLKVDHALTNIFDAEGKLKTLSADEARTLKLLLERAGKIQARTEVNITNNYNSIGDIETVKDLADWKAGQIAMQGRN